MAGTAAKVRNDPAMKWPNRTAQRFSPAEEGLLSFNPGDIPTKVRKTPRNCRTDTVPHEKREALDP
jgi:hypothetical protein